MENLKRLSLIFSPFLRQPEHSCMTDILKDTQDQDAVFDQVGDTTTIFCLFLIFLSEFYFFSA